MTKLLSLCALLIVFTTNVQAGVPNKISCFYDGGGYDDEYITFDVTPAGNTMNFKYESYRGEVGPFLKVSNRVFVHSAEEEIIFDTVTIEKDLSKATLVVSYKQEAKEFFRQTFACKYID